MTEKPMDKSPPPPDKGPCRETAVTALTRIRVGIERRLANVDALLKVAQHAEAGSPLEEALWTAAGNLDRVW